jgi:hypothetical protein
MNKQTPSTTTKSCIQLGSGYTVKAAHKFKVNRNIERSFGTLIILELTCILFTSAVLQGRESTPNIFVDVKHWIHELTFHTIGDVILLNGLITNVKKTKLMLQHIQTIITKAKCNALGITGD